MYLNPTESAAGKREAITDGSVTRQVPQPTIGCFTGGLMDVDERRVIDGIICRTAAGFGLVQIEMS